jgi:hypothetical protein
MMTLATLVIAGDADSTGKGSSGAFGNGSGSGAGSAAAAAAGPADRRVPLPSPGTLARAGTAISTEGFGREGRFGNAGGGNATLTDVALGFFSACFGRRGVSHRSQRIPRAIAAPHMKHFEAIEPEPWTAYLTPGSRSAAT